MEKKTDWQLVEEYYKGANDPIGELMINRHYNYLFFRGYSVFRREVWVKDAIQDVAEKLCNYAVPIRRVKFKPQKNNAKGALAMRVVSKVKDIARSLKKLALDLDNDDKGGYKEPVNTDDIEKIIEDQDLLDCIQSHLGAENVEFLAYMMEYPGKVKEIAEAMKKTADWVRKKKQQIKRTIKRIMVLGLCS